MGTNYLLLLPTCSTNQKVALLRILRSDQLQGTEEACQRSNKSLDIKFKEVYFALCIFGWIMMRQAVEVG